MTVDMNEPQPPPVPNEHEPSWTGVIAEIQDGFGGIVGLGERCASLVVADMRARDAEGRRKYGVPLQPHNGRDSLVDAYQEALDLVVYLWTALVEVVPFGSSKWWHRRDGVGADMWPMLERAIVLAGDLRMMIAGREAAP